MRRRDDSRPSIVSPTGRGAEPLVLLGELPFVEGQRLADCLGSLPSEDPLRPPAPQRHSLVAVDRDDRERRRVDQGLERLVGRPQLLLDLFALGDVEHVSLHVLGPPGLVSDDHVAVVEPDGAPVPGDHAVLVVVHARMRPGCAELVLAIVGMDDLAEEVRIRQPVGDRVPEDFLDLRAHVDRRDAGVSVVHVERQRQVLDERAVPVLGVAE